MKFKQAIQVPDHITQGIFNLDCVASCHKGGAGSFYYHLYAIKVSDNKQFVHPTEWLCQDESGMWHVLTNKEYGRL